MRRPRPSSRPRCCIVGRRWESLSEGMGDLGGVAGAAQVRAWRRPRGRAGEDRGQPPLGAAGSHPRPRDQRTSEGKRAPLSDSCCHETRAPEPGKTFGPGPLAPEKGAWSPPFPDVSLLLFLKRHLPLVRVYRLPAACVESWLLGCKMGTRAESPIHFSLPSEEREYKLSP